MLLILTTCDIHAVGPGRWNNWKAGLLKQLYTLTLAYLSGGQADQLEEAHIFDGTSKIPFITIVRRPEQSIAEVKVYAENTPHLFSELAGSLSAAGFNVVEAKISTLSNGMALDIFCLAVDQHVTDAKLDALGKTLTKSIAGEFQVVEELQRYGRRPALRSQALPAPARVLINNEESETHTLIEINGRDRAGLLYALATVFADFHLQVSSAKIATYGHRIVDVFYMRDASGHKIIDEAFLATLNSKLITVLNKEVDKVTLAGNHSG